MITDGGTGLSVTACNRKVYLSPSSLGVDPSPYYCWGSMRTETVQTCNMIVSYSYMYLIVLHVHL